MGVPKYFSYVIQNYPNILKNMDFFTVDGNKIHKLFVDSNSIIYDCLHKLNQDDYKSHEEFEDKIIEDVITHLEYLVDLVKPLYGTYIAFDGIPVFMKMEQQRMRRGRTLFLERYGDPNKWSLNNITPGMPFMEKLSRDIYKHFKKYKNILCSCSDELGEGEQKITKYIRENNMKNQEVAIYGLDADLIMLSLLHYRYCSNIFVFREAPEFMKSKLPISVKHENEIYFVDISLLSQRIQIEMGWKPSDRMIHEYVFLCFFLGNDFLPHIYSINIRTNGMDVLFDAYKKVCKNEKYLINEDHTINLKMLTKLFEYLAEDETARLEYEVKELNRYMTREKGCIGVSYMSVKGVGLEEKLWLGVVCERYVSRVKEVYKYYRLGEVSRWLGEVNIGGGVLCCRVRDYMKSEGGVGGVGGVGGGVIECKKGDYEEYHKYIFGDEGLHVGPFDRYI